MEGLGGGGGLEGLGGVGLEWYFGAIPQFDCRLGNKVDQRG